VINKMAADAAPDDGRLKPPPLDFPASLQDPAVQFALLCHVVVRRRPARRAGPDERSVHHP
jgi:hypothetical protein